MDVDSLKIALAELHEQGETVYGFTLTPHAFERFKLSVAEYFVAHGNNPNGVMIADVIKIEGVTVTCAKFQLHPVVRWPDEASMEKYLDVQWLEGCWDL